SSMPHRKLVQIGQKPKLPADDKLPTVFDYFRDLVKRQGEDIRLLKERALALAEEDAKRIAAARKKSIREESWRLHPVVAATDKKRPAAKKRTAKRAPR